MTCALWSVVAMMLLLYVSKFPVAVAMRREGGYDNRNPRDQQARLTGWGKRALGAHQNGFEVFPVFAVAVLIAHVSQGDATWVNRLAIYFVVSRIVYIGLYIADVATIRSLVWFSGLASCFVIAASGAIF